MRRISQSRNSSTTKRPRRTIKQSRVPYSGLVSYVSKLKGDWNIAVFDPKSRKRAVGATLPEAVEKLKKRTKVTDIVVLDYKTSEHLKKHRR